MVQSRVEDETETEFEPPHRLPDTACSAAMTADDSDIEPKEG